MTQKISRKRALELAQECIGAEMQKLAFDANTVIKYPGASSTTQRRSDRYAELAAALAYIENLARQKELL